MADKTKAEELAHSIAVKIWNDFMARPYNKGKPYNFSFKQLEQSIGKEVNNSSQSKIDELTKEVERLRKGIDWTRAEYIKCVNDSDKITEKLEELLTTH